MGRKGVEQAFNRHLRGIDGERIVIVDDVITDGATIQMGIGGIPDTVYRSLDGFKDLGVHTEMFSGWLKNLVEAGVVTNRRKTLHPGKAVAFALDALQDRGVFFIEAGENLYTGQIIGEYTRDEDLVVNAQKAKQLSNMRASGSDRKMKIAPPVRMSMEECLEHVNDDEYVEITPKSIRLRKSILDENERKKAAKRARLSGAED